MRRVHHVAQHPARAEAQALEAVDRRDDSLMGTAIKVTTK